MAKAHFTTEINTRLDITVEHYPGNSVSRPFYALELKHDDETITLFLGTEQFADLQKQLLANINRPRPLA